jgi:hypothetical protein
MTETLPDVHGPGRPLLYHQGRFGRFSSLEDL